jgi:hypothetical protein
MRSHSPAETPRLPHITHPFSPIAGNLLLNYHRALFFEEAYTNLARANLKRVLSAMIEKY